MAEYRKLNFNKIKFSEETISYEDAVSKNPLVFADSVMSQQQQVKFTKAEKDYDNKCVKLVTSC